MKNLTKLIFSIFFVFLLHNGYPQSKMPDTLLAHFVSPPDAAKPRVWWHWMNGNITKDGISRDLLWMKRSGIGGFQNFDAALATPQIVEKRLTYMTPEWRDAFKFTAKLADSLHLEMAIAGSPGWSESGGPWVQPKDGMKKIVWSETVAEGGKPFAGTLAKPPTNTGIFQNLPMPISIGLGVPAESPPTYYQDIKVIAYKLPPSDISLIKLNAKISSSGGNFDLAQLTDGDLAATNLLPSDTTNGYAWVQFQFEAPQLVKAVTVVGGGDKGPFGMFGELKESRSLEVSENGTSFKRICFIPAGGVLQQTISIPPTKSRFFRVTFKNPEARPNFGAMLGTGGAAPKAPAGTEIAEIVLHTASRINRFEEKAAYATASDLYSQATPSSDAAVAETDVIDVTTKMNDAGLLNWTPPEGNWNILRFGFSLTGKQNHPASPEATGLEVDKLDAVAVKSYFDNYLNQYENATGGFMGATGGLQFMVTDSWEAGVQNWTGQLAAEFLKRRGYNLINWMPVLTGRVIKSAEASEHFLWDFRKTLSELVAENHYDQLTTILASHGMKRYSESHESGRALIADGMEVKRKAAVPMSAMWTPGAIGGDGTGYKSDIRESASVAHIYGQNLVAAESLTAIGNAWSYSPEKLKPTADLEMANGLNRFVIHTSVHQPNDEKIPGLGLGPFGQWFNRHETWAEQAKAWTSYLARSCYLLQQGKFVADIIYYYGEDNNITSLFATKLPAVPQGYNFDYVNADALVNLLEVKDGKIATPSGMSYRLLVLDSNSTQMTLKVLKKIRTLAMSGAVIVGPKPVASPSLSDSPQEFTAIVNELWQAGVSVTTAGKGKLYSNTTIAAVLNELQVVPDFQYTVPADNAQLLYVHRSLSGKDFYWINNRSDKVQDVEGSFRITGKTVEIWHPETGKTEPASYEFSNGITKVPLHLQPNDAVFVVFKENTTKNSVVLAKVNERTLSEIDGNWKIAFQKDRGAPAQVVVDKLLSWTDNAAPGIKYFSGEASYTKTVTAAADWFKKGASLWLDLGDVKNLAEVMVNGKSLGIVWKKPFRVEVSSALKSGQNAIVVKVVNLWVNRLIGDKQPGVDKPITYTTMAFYNATSPLLPSGLLGPVKFVSLE